MDFLVNTLSFIFALSVIIVVHEGGHYLMARVFDVKILTFSLGFGKKIVAVRRGETEYRVSWVPLGGYVRLGGEHPDEVTDDPRDFQRKPRWQRILVYVAGPAANVVLAIGLIAVVFVIGLEVPYLQDIPPVVGTVEVGSPAEVAGLQRDDRIVQIKGRDVRNWQDVHLAILEAPEPEVSLVVTRDGRQFETVVTPAKVSKYEFGDAGLFPRLLPQISMVGDGTPALAAGFEVRDEIRAVDGRPLATPMEFVEHVSARAGQEVVVEVTRDGRVLELTVVPADQDGVGRIGVGLSIAKRFPPGRAVIESCRYNWNVAVQTVALVGKLVRREVKPQSALHGPIEIAALSGQAARQGVSSLLHLMGLVSISIAILNLFPIPVLDGGQITILLVESVMRRDLSLRLKEAVNLLGLAMIMVLMVTVILFDLGRNLPFERGEPAPVEVEGE